MLQVSFSQKWQPGSIHNFIKKKKLFYTDLVTCILYSLPITLRLRPHRNTLWRHKEKQKWAITSQQSLSWPSPDCNSMCEHRKEGNWALYVSLCVWNLPLPQAVHSGSAVSLKVRSRSFLLCTFSLCSDLVLMSQNPIAFPSKTGWTVSLLLPQTKWWSELRFGNKGVCWVNALYSKLTF